MTSDHGNRPQRPVDGRGVYLVDDHEIVRRGLRQLLESHGLIIGENQGPPAKRFGASLLFGRTWSSLMITSPTVPGPRCAAPSPRRPLASGAC